MNINDPMLIVGLSCVGIIAIAVATIIYCEIKFPQKY